MLELKNINYSIDNKIILKDISLKLDYGNIVAITGHNGSGKSTLVKIIMGIIKANSGQIILDNEDITNLSINEHSKKGISFTFQQPVKFKGLTVSDLLETAQGTQTKLVDACQQLSKVGLCAKDYIMRELDGRLSGGELKRIELAICLAEDKKINIFDEPEAGIDLWSFDGITNLFKDLKEKGKLLIVVTHQKKILDIADTIVVLNSAQIDRIGTSKDISPLLDNLTCKRLDKGE